MKENKKLAGKVCENCKYEDVGIFEKPCRDCLIATNDLWEPKDDKP